jgi:hypothetical protein
LTGLLASESARAQRTLICLIANQERHSCSSEFITT